MHYKLLGKYWGLIVKTLLPLPGITLMNNQRSVDAFAYNSRYLISASNNSTLAYTVHYGLISVSVIVIADLNYTADNP